jgi:ribonuclease HI
MDKVEIYSDGACRAIPAVAAGARCWWPVEKEIFGGEPNTTNNRMELMAVIGR